MLLKGNNVMRLILLLLMLGCLSQKAQAAEVFPERAPPRIVSLFLNTIHVPAVEPALPEDFIAMRSPNPDDPKYYWGRQDALEYFFETGDIADSVPIISARISDTLPQSSLNKDTVVQFIRKELIWIGVRNPKVEFSEWGSYPVVGMELTSEGNKVLFAWVGMNRPTGESLVLTYHFAKGGNHPTRDERRLWDTFINKTKVLPAPLNYQAQGLDLHEGYTVFSNGLAKIRAIAEKRKRDGVELIAMQPLNTQTTFTFQNLTRGKMNGDWKRNQPLVKIHGKIGADEASFDQTMVVLIKDVDEFSISPDQLKMNQSNWIHDGQQKN